MMIYILMLDKRYQPMVERYVDMETPQQKTGASGEPLSSVASAGNHRGVTPLCHTLKKKSMKR
jgi:hypothetical protein